MMRKGSMKRPFIDFSFHLNMMRAIMACLSCANLQRQSTRSPGIRPPGGGTLSSLPFPIVLFPSYLGACLVGRDLTLKTLAFIYLSFLPLCALARVYIQEDGMAYPAYLVNYKMN